MAINLFEPKFHVADCIAQITDCMEKGWTGLGYKTMELEEKWREYTGLPNAYFVNSCTAALNIAVRLLKEKYDWQPEDEIITTPNTFVSTNHAILRSGLKAVFADVDDTACLSPDKVREKLTPRTRAVMFVGLGGSTGGLPEIAKICREHDLRLILDAAHMAGTRLNGEMPGREADAVCYSFHAVKNLPTSDSGMVCFSDRELDRKARQIGWLGIDKDTYQRSKNAGGYAWEYNVRSLGDKYHGNSLTAAVALGELPYLEAGNRRRREIAALYEAAFSPYEDRLRLVRQPKGCESSRHLYQIMVGDRLGLMEYLRSKQINTGVHYVSNTRYDMYSYAAGSCPAAEYISDHVLSLPMHLNLTDGQVGEITEAVVEFVMGQKNGQ